VERVPEDDVDALAALAVPLVELVLVDVGRQAAVVGARRWPRSATDARAVGMGDPVLEDVALERLGERTLLDREPRARRGGWPAPRRPPRPGCWARAARSGTASRAMASSAIELGLRVALRHPEEGPVVEQAARGGSYSYFRFRM
jgi:hypothetical protein